VGGRVVPVRLDEETLAAIDALVGLGIYKSRSEALRELVKAGLRQAGWSKVIDVVKKMLEEAERGSEPLRLDGALEQLLRERRER